MSRAWSRYGLAVLLIVLVGATSVAFAQNPTFSLEGVVTDAQQAVLPGATVTVQNISTGLTRVRDDRRGRTLRRSRAAARGPLQGAGRAARLRDGDPRRPHLQRRPERRPELLAEALDGAGDDHRRRRCADRADDVGRGVEHDRSDGVREPAGQGAQLLPSADARLQRRRRGNRLERGERRRPGSVELRHLRGRHEQPLEVADAAARAAARVERLRHRDGQGSAAHHQPVLRRVRRALGWRVEHDHQERHQRAQRIGVRDDPARRPGRRAAAGARRERREDEGALQPAAIRRHGRRSAGQGQAVLLRQLRAPPRAKPGGRDLAGGVRPGRADAGRRAPGPRQDATSASPRRTRSACATTWCAGRRTTRAAA